MLKDYWFQSYDFNADGVMCWFEDLKYHMKVFEYDDHRDNRDDLSKLLFAADRGYVNAFKSLLKRLTDDKGNRFHSISHIIDMARSRAIEANNNEIVTICRIASAAPN